MYTCELCTCVSTCACGVVQQGLQDSGERVSSLCLYDTPS